MDEGQRVFLFIAVLGVFIVCALAWPRIAGFLNRLFNMPSNVRTEKILFVFVHCMVLVVLIQLGAKIYDESNFYLKYLELLTRPVRQPTNNLDFLIWFLALAPILILGLVQIRFRNKTTSLYQKWKNEYKENSPAFVISSYGFICLVSAVVNCGFYVVSFITSWIKYLGGEFSGSIFGSVGFLLIAFFCFLADTGSRFLIDFAMWKRLKVSFRPYLVLCGAKTFIAFASSVLDCVEKKNNYSRYTSEVSFWLDRIVLEHYLLPMAYFLMAGLIYSWSWFAFAGVEEDKNLPKVMNQSDFWKFMVGIQLLLVLASLGERMLALFNVM